MSNLPLFLLAAPTIVLLLVSSIEAIRHQTTYLSRTAETKESRRAYGIQQVQPRSLLRIIALPQLVLTVLAVTNFHVQIITRIATGYPLHYVWIASKLCDGSKLRLLGGSWDIGRWTIRWMIMYGVVQGGLYASFLPPA